VPSWHIFWRSSHLLYAVSGRDVLKLWGILLHNVSLGDNITRGVDILRCVRVINYLCGLLQHLIGVLVPHRLCIRFVLNLLLNVHLRACWFTFGLQYVPCTHVVRHVRRGAWLLVCIIFYLLNIQQRLLYRVHYWYF